MYAPYSSADYISILFKSHLALHLNNFKMFLLSIITITYLIIELCSPKLPLIDCNTRF